MPSPNRYPASRLAPRGRQGLLVDLEWVSAYPTVVHDLLSGAVYGHPVSHYAVAGTVPLLLRYFDLAVAHPVTVTSGARETETMLAERAEFLAAHHYRRLWVVGSPRLLARVRRQLCGDLVEVLARQTLTEALKTLSFTAAERAA